MNNILIKNLSRVVKDVQTISYPFFLQKIAVRVTFILIPFFANAQIDTTTYHLTIKEELVNKAGKEVIAMTINGSIPGPTLRFKEGGYAVIYVTNDMPVETSVHWHGILIPNFYDGVPYLSTPPILPGKTFKYEFPLVQSGTYWYHSHTMLQEQSGVFGSIVIDAKDEKQTYDKDLVIVLSDWTNQKPRNVLRNLKRRNEWYDIKKKTAAPLNRVIAQGALGAQIKFWQQRMESADIADVYYNAFLSNGEKVASYPDFKAGEKVRLRIINGSASSQFWMTFGGEEPLLVAADGLDVIPVKHGKTFIAIAETYDFIITIPENKKIELRAMAQDGSGHSSTWIGNGEALYADSLPRPNKITMMKQMAKMNMRMGAPALKFQPSKDERYKMKRKWGMRMNKNHSMKEESMADMHHQDSIHKDRGNMNRNMKKEMPMKDMDMFAEYNYDYLKSPEKTAYDSSAPVNEILLNLTGNMQRYVWSINGVPISETDKIEIKKGVVTRITLNNLTMMHHPMHLHGHFFRVLNKNGEYSPLKHTVNVPPMKEVTIEFIGDTYGDWFFHCHVLYHMMSGMARIFSYDTPRDNRLSGFPLKKLLNEADRLYNWGTFNLTSHMTSLNLMSSSIRNIAMLNIELGWNKNMEAELTYGRYLYDYISVFGGVNVENEQTSDLEKLDVTAIAGIRYFSPYMFNADIRLDNLVRPQISLSRSLMVFPRTIIFGSYEYQIDFGWVRPLEDNATVKNTFTWSAGARYFIARNFLLTASYDNRFGAGVGFSARF